MPASAMAVSRCRRLACAGMSPSSESHRNELVVVDRLGLRHGAEDSELLERMPDEVDRLEPAAQETPQQVRLLVDDVVGCKDDVSVEILRDIAEQDEVSGLAGLLQLVAGRRLDHHAVEFAALDGSKPRLHLAQRQDLDAVTAPALLAR